MLCGGGRGAGLLEGRRYVYCPLHLLGYVPFNSFYWGRGFDLVPTVSACVCSKVKDIDSFSA